ncbi:MAG: YdcF family protein [Limisphaerales bacterium]
MNISDWISTLAEPLPFAWTLLIFYVLVRLWRREWRRAFLPTLLAAGIFALGSTTVSTRLLAHLERPYAGLDYTKLPPADVVIMLGGMMRPSTNDVFGGELTHAADRLITAAQVTRTIKPKALILGGGGLNPGQPGRTEGEINQRWLAEWGLPGAPVLLLGPCRNTRDEAERSKALIEQHGWKRVILVTSASHMRRSEAVFRDLGMDVVPVACDFRGLAHLVRNDPFNPFPALERFDHLNVACHEYIGWWVYRLRGWV